MEVQGGAEPLGLQLICRAFDSGVLACLSDRDWRTLSGVLSFFGTETPDLDRCRIDFIELGARIKETPEEARQRLNDLTSARIKDEPIVWVVEESADSAAVWLNCWWFGSVPGGGTTDLGPVINYYRRVVERNILSPAETQALHRWREDYGLGREVIIELLEECYRRGVKHVKYLEAVARAWHDDGVRTLGDLQRRRSDDRELIAKYTRLVNYLSLGRALTEPEKRLMRKWSREWGFSDEVILRACDQSTGFSNPMKAVDRVLEAWRDLGVRTVSDAEGVLREYRSGKGRSQSQGVAPKEARRNPGRSKSADDYDDLFLR